MHFVRLLGVLPAINTFETVSVPGDRHLAVRLVGVGPYGPTLAVFVYPMLDTLMDTLSSLKDTLDFY